MTVNPQEFNERSQALYRPGLHRYALLVAASTFVLIFAGGLVTSTGSGLAVPDWPLSFGQVFPEMTGGVLFEHGHRMVAATVGMMTIGLFVWALSSHARKSVKVLAGCALAAVVIQGLLGGLTVLMKLPPAVSVAHASLAQLFLCSTVALAVMTGPGWDARPLKKSSNQESVPLTTLGLAATVTVFGQLVLGAVMRHTNAGLAIPDFPLAFGKIIPPLNTATVQIHFAHRVWAVVVCGVVGLLAMLIVRRRRREPRFYWPAFSLLGLLVTQVTLGGLTVLLKRAVVPTTLHVLVGGMILAFTFLITMKLYRETWLLGLQSSAGLQNAAEGAPA
jgi:cytochrome c oxidase assembly protein subunit 15